MSPWGPVTKSSTLPVDWVAQGALAPCVLVSDLTAEFGPSYTMNQSLIDLATEQVEDMLNRPLRNAIYTERLRVVYDSYVDPLFGMAGSVRPRAIPVQNVITPVGALIIDFGVELRYIPPDDFMLGFWNYSDAELYGTITYQGGRTPNMMPSDLRTLILKVAIRMFMRQTPGSMMDVAAPGVNNPHVGDVSFVTGKEIGSLFDADDRRVLKRYKYRSPF